MVSWPRDPKALSPGGQWGLVGTWGCPLMPRPQASLGWRDGGKHPVCQQLALPIPTTTRGWEVAPATWCLYFGIPTNTTKLLAPSSLGQDERGQGGPSSALSHAELHWHLTLLHGPTSTDTKGLWPGCAVTSPEAHLPTGSDVHELSLAPGTQCQWGS